MKCSKCGLSGDKVGLFDAISEKGIVKVCEKCSFEDSLVLVKNQVSGFPEEHEKKKTVYERVSHMSGFDLRNKKSEKELVKKQETTLRDIVDRNFKKNISEKSKPRPDLFDNFHWIIMRARRMKHISQRQLAEVIAEPEAAIKMAERGVLSGKDYPLINKLENYLGIKLVKKQVPYLYAEKENIMQQSESKILSTSHESQIKEQTPKLTDFSPITTKSLTISDLQEMKKKKESGVFDKEINKEDLSQEEINEIIFKKE